jgi:tight adherence protein B
MTSFLTRVGRVTATAATGLIALVVVAAPAFAEPSGRISDLKPSPDGTLTLVFSASDLPENVSIDPASVTASVDGTSVSAKAVLVSAQAPVARTAVLAIDTSASMEGAKLQAAKQAATTYLDAAPDDLMIGLVTFDRDARVSVSPTIDRAALKAEISGLKTKDGTALFDGVVLASETVGKTGSRSILLLSDGGDYDSRTTGPEATAAVASSGATLDAVALATSTAQLGVLTDLATATGGKVVPSSADAAELAAAFAASARAVDNQLSVTIQVPAALASSGRSVTVSAVAGGTTLTDSAYVPIPGAPQASPGATELSAAGPIPVSSPAIYDRVDKTWLWAGLIAIFVGVGIMLAVAFIRASRKSSTSVRGRMSIYTLGGGRAIRKESETTSTALGDTQVARSAVELADRAVRSRDVEELLERKLDAAGLPLKPGEWALVHVGIAVGSGLLLLLLTGGRIVASLVGLILGVVLPWVYLGIKESRRQAAFYSQLPDTLQLLAGSLSAGYSLPQAVDTVVREGQDPMAAEFNRALVEARLGVPIEDAMDNIADRMNSQDFHWVVLAIRVQREVGGNLAEVLTTVAATLRERERLRRQVQVLSAEGRLSAVIIALIPILFAVFLLIARPTYLEPLYSTPLGLLMLGFGAFMLVVGIFWLRRVVQVEV